MLTLRKTALTLACLFGFGLTACNDTNVLVYLTRPGVGNAEEATRYYRNIKAESTFKEWLANRCFDQPGAQTTKAFYYNDSDLGLGREMQCAICPNDAPKNPGLLSCAVSNHGVPRDFDLQANHRPREQSIKKALGDLESFLATGNPKRGATVTMDYLSSRMPDTVRFFIYDGDDPAKLQPGNTVPGGLIPGLQLDSEGVKFIRNCMSCHGGRYDTQRDLIIGSSFLDFDISLLVFGDDQFVKDAQPAAGDKNFVAVKTQRSTNLEPMRVLNSMVLLTNPAPPVAARVTGSYPGCKVSDPGCQYKDGYVPDGWKGVPQNEQIYKQAAHKHCATCHFSQNVQLNLQADLESQKKAWTFDSAQQWIDAQNQLLIRRTTCESSDMPHAEVTRNNLRQNSLAFSTICVTPR